MVNCARKSLLFVGLALVGGLVGCSSPTYYYRAKDGSIRHLPKDEEMVPFIYAATDQLVQNAHRAVSSDAPILVASFVNVNNLQESSSFGRIMAEQVTSRLAQRGYRPIEMKLRRDSVFIKKEAGEFLLSRELQQLSSEYNASGVVVGTYAVARNEVFVSIRLVRVDDNSVLSGTDFSMPIGLNTLELLKQSGEAD